MRGIKGPIWRVLLLATLALTAWPHPGWPAVAVLALGFPSALLLSHRNAEKPHAAWAVMTLPLAVALWRISECLATPITFVLVLLALAGALAFATVGRTPTFRWHLILSVLTCLVAYFSGGQGSSGAMLRWLMAHGLSDEAAHVATLAFRKTVHFTFYGSLAWTTLRATKSPPSALFAALTVASFDELRQSGYASRTGSSWDVLLDLAGASFFVGLSVLRDRAKR